MWGPYPTFPLLFFTTIPHPELLPSRSFGECPLYFSALQNSQNVFKVLFSQSQFDHLRYNSLTLALSQKLLVNLLNCILLSLIVWPHRNFRWLLILSIGSAYIHVKMATSYLSRNMITTRFRQSFPNAVFFPNITSPAKILANPMPPS